jgi:hypothetical protein
MRAYVITTGAFFGLLTAIHVWRLIEEGTGLIADPFFLAFTLLGAAMTVWAWRLLRGRAGTAPPPPAR